MADRNEVQQALFAKLLEVIDQTGSPARLRDLAEAFAWTVNPNQPHGATTVSVGK